jgi:non-ribosomal peptide synthetase component E (peptide arylation enzyme)
MANYKVPCQIEFLKELRRNASGKIAKIERAKLQPALD